MRSAIVMESAMAHSSMGDGARPSSQGDEKRELRRRSASALASFVHPYFRFKFAK
jgi:hypothetical protein